MERQARGRGCAVRARDGWNVAVGYGAAEAELRLRRPSAFADRSHLRKLELHGRAGRARSLEAGVAERRDGRLVVPGDAGRATLVLGGPRGARGGGRGRRRRVVDLTLGLRGAALIGPAARELLARFCAIDVRPTVTPVARASGPDRSRARPGYVLRERRGPSC